MSQLLEIGPNGVIPKLPYVIVKADLDQKKKHIVPGTDVELIIENQYNENLRERNPNYAEVVYSSEEDEFMGYDNKKFKNILKPGDRICLQHFQLLDHSNNSQAVAIDSQGEQLFIVDIKEVYFKIDEINRIDTPVMLSDYTLCERTEVENITEEGILIPDSAYDQYHRSSGRAIVDFKSDTVDSVEVGDVILYEKYADYELEFNGKTYLKISESEILGHFTDGKVKSNES